MCAREWREEGRVRSGVDRGADSAVASSNGDEDHTSDDYAPELAIALGYAPGDDVAPRVLAAGQGDLATRIRELAEAHGVALHEDEELASLLARVPHGNEIPAELYPVVAEIFAFLWSLSTALPARSP